MCDMRSFPDPEIHLSTQIFLLIFRLPSYSKTIIVTIRGTPLGQRKGQERNGEARTPWLSLAPPLFAVTCRHLTLHSAACRVTRVYGPDAPQKLHVAYM